MLTSQDIKKYQQIYKKVYGVDISYAEALEQGNRVLKFFKVILKPNLVKNIDQI